MRAVTDLSETGLVWSANEVRHFYKELKIWPSFLGLPLETSGGMKKKPLAFEQKSNSMEQQLAESLGKYSTTTNSYMPLPILLWPEEYNAIKNSGINDENRSKRRRVSSPDSTVPETWLDLCAYNALHSFGNHKYFVGPADVYGGDYCLYKGASPDESHSVATVKVINSNKIRVKELLAFSRVQNQVAKSAVIMYTSKATENNDVPCVIFNFRNVSVRS